MKLSLLFVLLVTSSISKSCSYTLTNKSIEDRINEYGLNKDVIIFEGNILSLEYDTTNIDQNVNGAPEYLLIEPKRCWQKMHENTSLIKLYVGSACSYQFEVGSTYLIYAENVIHKGITTSLRAPDKAYANCIRRLENTWRTDY